MLRKDPVDRRLPWVRKIHDLDGARTGTTSAARLSAIRIAAERLGDSLRSGPRVLSVRTLPLTTLLYPTKYAFGGAALSPAPYVYMVHRCLFVQVLAEGEVKNILFNPTDYIASRATPFFKKLIDRYGEFISYKLLARAFGQVEEQLAKLGIAAGDIDVIAFDHFHTQDLRPLLGTGVGMAARFPNAHLLAPRREWEDWDDLHPFQAAWFIADGKKDLPAERVILTDDDLALGDGCLLLRTPGHTSGNQTLFAHTEQGVFGCSENGTSADNWSPAASRIAGLRGFAAHQMLDVVLNANTPELGIEQYTSMMLERSLVDRVAEAPSFVQMFPSSEVTPSFLALGIRPTWVFGERTSGTVHKTRHTAQVAPVQAHA
jgi:glyoxylase-like metal-dependent hydrolase (beta-lactamase superfamily II)